VGASGGRGGRAYAQVRAVTRVASDENEERVLDIALAPTSSMQST
jgi:hypothetical protein